MLPGFSWTGSKSRIGEVENGWNGFARTWVNSNNFRIHQLKIA